LQRFLIALAASGCLAVIVAGRIHDDSGASGGRREVVFWHKWGGKDRHVVEEIAEEFNQSQNVHYVRAVAMPGNNLDLKFLLAAAGNDPPDLVNQDRPVIADWAHRGALLPIEEIAPRDEYAGLADWLFPAARKIGTYDGRLYGLCNGLDIRAMVYDADVLRRYGLSTPGSIAELDALAERVAPPGIDAPGQYAYLPDPRRIWAWGIVFGGRFYDPETGEITADSEPIVSALAWMASYSDRYGAQRVLAYRTGDQSLAGKTFPLLAGRYAAIMDGQWRVREIAEAVAAARSSGRPPPRFTVAPLPVPEGGVAGAGWVNGNVFVVPRGGNNPEGAWEFMKFWSGYGGREAGAARICIAGGWIPASGNVVRQPEFQRYLRENPAFETFVRLAGSPNQIPTPPVPGGPLIYDEVVRAAEEAMYKGRSPREALEAATLRIREHLERRNARGRVMSET
jgi:multiple sugar transport system substrate-binding protein